MTDQTRGFAGLNALLINTTLTRSPGASHTQLLIDVCAEIMTKQGVTVDQFRAADHRIATGVYPDTRTRGWEVDEWPDLFPRVMAADILVIGGPIWLGDNSSETKKIIERLDAHSGELTCSMTAPRAGLHNDFTNRNRRPPVPSVEYRSSPRSRNDLADQRLAGSRRRTVTGDSRAHPERQRTTVIRSPFQSPSIPPGCDRSLTDARCSPGLCSGRNVVRDLGGARSPRKVSPSGSLRRGVAPRCFHLQWVSLEAREMPSMRDPEAAARGRVTMDAPIPSASVLSGTDHDLIRSLRAGNAAAFAQLDRRHGETPSTCTLSCARAARYLEQIRVTGAALGEVSSDNLSSEIQAGLLEAFREFRRPPAGLAVLDCATAGAGAAARSSQKPGDRPRRAGLRPGWRRCD